MAQKLEVKTDTDKFTLKGRSCELSAFAFVPTKRNEPAERTVFNTPKNVSLASFVYIGNMIFSSNFRYLIYVCAIFCSLVSDTCYIMYLQEKNTLLC